MEHSPESQDIVSHKSNGIVLCSLLTHFKLIKLLNTIYWKKSNFSFRYIRLCDLDIPREKRINYLQKGGNSAEPSLMQFAGSIGVMVL